jgi:TPR repeat protein
MAEVNVSGSTLEDVRRTFRNGVWLFLSIVIVFASLTTFNRVNQSTAVLTGFWIAIIASLAGLLWCRIGSGGSLPWQLVIRKPHIIQTCVQSGVFLYWGSAWSPVYEQAPLIFAQVCLAYLCEAYFSWRRFGLWRVGFGPFPVVLSTNLFLWFIDDYFAYQFAMILLAYWSRDVLCTVRDGRRSHLFNPSAFGLGIAAIAIVVLHIPDVTHGQMIAQTLGNPEHPYILIFLMGFVVQAFFKVTFVTMAAALTMVGLGYVYTVMFGTYQHIDTAIPIAVFLGMNLLVTDPATSPKSIAGRCVFGMLYGAMVFFSYDALRNVNIVSALSGQQIEISWLDKLLCVPILNLLAQPIERWVGRLDALYLNRWWLKHNTTHLGLWACAFMVIYPQLSDHQGKQLVFWETACEQDLRRACSDRAKVYAKLCSEQFPEVCFNQGRGFEAGSGVPVSRSSALDSYKRACKGGLTLGCAEAFRICESSDALCSFEQRERLLEQGCLNGSESACITLAQKVVTGEFKTINIGTLVNSMSVGCAKGVQGACAGIFAASVTKLKPRFGADTDFARIGFASACDGGYLDGCVNLGLMDARGDGGQRDLSKARQRFNKACQLGHQKACTLNRQLEDLGGK